MGPIRSGSGDDELGAAAPLSEINVTPLVDVMLVLLIIFMVAAPLMTVGVPVQLPKTAAPKVSEPKKPIVVTVDSEGQPYLGKEALAPGNILARLSAVAKEYPGQVVLVRGDRGVPYGRVMEVMGQVGAAGFTKVSLIAQGAPASATGTE
jgi:biopolymer transport protein TolR